MIRLIDKFTGDDKWVADSRLNEYLAAGYKLADKGPEPEPTEKKKTRKK